MSQVPGDPPTVLRLAVDSGGPYTLTFPTSYPVGEGGTVTSRVLAPSTTHEFIWVRSTLNGGSYLLVDSSWLTPVTIAQLPASAQLGQLAVISDGAAGHSWGDTVGGDTPGETTYLLWWNGTAWTVVGK